MDSQDDSFDLCIKRQEAIKKEFSASSGPEEKYQKIMVLGRALPTLNEEFKIPSNLVQGCQSAMYLHTFFESGCVHFQVHSEALISSGLAALLINVYSDLPPKTILTCPPLFIEALDLRSALTPGRSNGLASLHLRMKQEALRYM
jgi:cysteine desulfuration protein SufE